MSSPPLLVSPKAREKLYLYLAASEETLAAVLIKETARGQFPVYYVSKALHDSELNYSKIEKLAYSLLMASREPPHHGAYRSASQRGTTKDDHLWSDGQVEY